MNEDQGTNWEGIGGQHLSSALRKTLEDKQMQISRLCLTHHERRMAWGDRYQADCPERPDHTAWSGNGLADQGSGTSR